jgi:xanthine dehydrogenase iron-sulfur cluster and FAD-binding subunit A
MPVLADENQATIHPIQQAMVDMHGSQCGMCIVGWLVG